MTHDTQSFDVRLEPMNPGTLISISGVLNEQASFDTLPAEIRAPVTIDLSGVRFLTSMGLMQWIWFLRALSDRAPIVLRRCSTTMVTQFSMVTDALLGAKVESLEAPYACASCGREETHLFELPRDLPEGSRSSVPTYRCACGGQMVFDDLPERFLAFLDP